MNILHYSLGFPPYRRGGMTKYCIDLMAEQIRTGHEVAMLWPGRIKKYGYKCNIKQVKSQKINNKLLCKSYEIINPLPVPLLNGIKEFDAFTQEKDEFVFYEFFKNNKIDVIHIHTLMGLPKECIYAAKKLNIRLVYTTHDYFGICPKWGLMYRGNICDNDNECKKCVECNKTALSLNKIKILQSNIYKYLKDLSFVKLLRKKHNDNLYEETNKKNEDIFSIDDEVINISKEYNMLRKFYIEMLENMDVIHFNSSNTERIFNRYFSTRDNGVTISITHSSISNNKINRNYKDDLNLGYLGPITEHKGFFSLNEVCNDIYMSNKGKFKLHIFAEYDGNEEYIIKHKPYKYSELSLVMDQIDILIVPSIWNETFGFTVLEALSYGVPVMVSKNVGSKDLISLNKSGIVFGDNLDELRENIIMLLSDSNEKLKTMNNYIVEYQDIKIMKYHAEEIMKCYS